MPHVKGFWVFGIVYSNYIPDEVDSLYTYEEHAKKRCEELNEEDEADGHSGMWVVKQMWVSSENDINDDDPFGAPGMMGG